MTANFRILGPNYADSANPTFPALSGHQITPSQAAALPTSNLQIPDRGYVWRSTDDTDQSLTGVWIDGSSYTLSAFVLNRHNFSASAEVRLRWFGDQLLTTTLWDSGTLALGSTLGWGDFDWGPYPWGGERLFPAWMNQYLVIWTPPTDFVVAWQLDIHDDGGADGYFRASRVMVGKYFEPVTNVSEGVRVYPKDTSTQRRTYGGSLLTQNRTIFRCWEAALGNLNETERQAMFEIMWQIGLQQDTFISVYPEEGGKKERDHAGVVKCVQMPPFEQHHNDQSRLNFVFEES